MLHPRQRRAEGLRARTGSTHDLAAIIDRDGPRDAIAGKRRQGQRRSIALPDGGVEVENLRGNAAWILHGVLSDAHDVAAVVNARRFGIVAS